MVDSGLVTRPLALAGTAVAVLALLAPTSVVGAPTPGPDQADERVKRSTNVVLETPRGRLSAYVVNAADPARTTAVAALVDRYGTVVQQWPEIGVVVAHSRRARFRDRIRESPLVASAGATRSRRPVESIRARPDTEPQIRREVRRVPTADPREKRQWDMRAIRAVRAHAITDGSAEVLVGILDTGIDHDHPDLAAAIDREASVDCTDAGRPDTSRRGWRPTISSHGTHVAGTVAAARNGVGIVGVAPAARLASVKVVGDDGRIYPEYAVCGFMWAGLQGMDVTNSSYYVDPFLYYCADRPDQAAAMEAVRRAVEWSTAQGVVHAAAAGNAATDLSRNRRDDSSPNDARPVRRRINSGCLTIPAELPGVVTVSSHARVRKTRRTRLSFFSNAGLGVVDVAAPGSNILSTVGERNGYARYSGTSMASPHVAGVLALLVATFPDATPAQLRATVREQARDRVCRRPESGSPLRCEGTRSDNSFSGEGMVDALAAVTP